MPIDREALSEIDPEILLATGWEDAFIGLTENHHHETCAVYDYDKIIEIMVDRDDMTHEDAEEFAQFNIVGAYVGERTPIYVRRVGVTPQAEPETPSGDRAADGLPDQGGMAGGVIVDKTLPRVDEGRVDPNGVSRFGDIVEMLEKYCHQFDADQMHAVCDRAAYVIRGLRASVQHYKQTKSLSKQVEALERRLEESDRALHKSMAK